MQAYATAARTPQEGGFGALAASAWNGAAPTRTGSIDTSPANGASSAAGSTALASLLIGSLDDDALALLARRLRPHLDRPERATVSAVAYTVPSLAKELGVSPKTIRCAIARGELRAVKRGARWIISAQSVGEWATTQQRQRTTTRRCQSSAPRAAGPSLRSVFCGAPQGAAGSTRTTR